MNKIRESKMHFEDLPLKEQVKEVVFSLTGNVVSFGLLNLVIHEYAHAVAFKVLFANSSSLISFWPPYCDLNMGSPKLSYLGKLFGENGSFSMAYAAGYLSTILAINGLLFLRSKRVDRMLVGTAFLLGFQPLGDTVFAGRIGPPGDIFEDLEIPDIFRINRNSGWIPAAALSALCVATAIRTCYRFYSGCKKEKIS